MRSRVLFLALVVGALLFSAAAAKATTLTVNSTGDGDRFLSKVAVCETAPGNGQCTLRAAIQTANAFAGDDTIQFAIPTSDPGFSKGVCTINLTAALPQLTTNISITGPGPNALTVRPGTAGQYRVFIVTNAPIVVTISGLTISSGGAHDSNGGGGVLNGSATVNMTNCILAGNRSFAGSGSSGLGGAISNNIGTMNISDTVVTGNQSDGLGGGICNRQGTVNLVRSVVSDNQAGSAGGGISNVFDPNQTPTLNVTNSTITGNTSASSGGGIAGGGTTSITNSTITGNVASTNTGGGITSPANTTNVKSTIIALNTAPSAPDVSGNFFSAGFNLIGKIDGSTGFTVATDQTGTIASPLDPKLDPNGLQNNGGPTKTIALLAGSPAIDKGSNSNAARDQRNYVRSGAPDVGAFEFGGTIPVDLANISTRLLVGTGDNVLFGGFIVSGTQSKRVIVLATGPSLNLAGKLADPTLELYQGGTLLESNDNWVDSVNKQPIIDSGFAPANNLESAIIRTLPANNSQYTVIVRGVSNGTGIGVVQIFDLDRTVDSKLANISTRGLVQTGDNVVIGGFIVLGADPQKVIVIALGPSLPVPGKLADPTLELRDGNGGLIDSNDNWVDSPNKQAIIDSTVPPTNGVESAVVATLPSNGAHYTAIVRGVNNSTGVAVVEVFALQ
jgi:CSLREA domain-containing protein